ncbi:CBS domain-containing protein [Halobacteriales archaeon SW_7_68_16]|nr:MAG: CBS domain-containing protein [Halobacteriales archaeon SW_7_68_16]
MNIADIAAEEYLEVDVGTRLGKVRSIFERENPKGIIVTRDGEYANVLSERDLLQSHVEDDAKVSALIKASRNDPAPKMDRHENVREVARKLVEGNTKVAPVYEGEKLYGIVTEDQILEAVLSNLDALTVGEIYTDDPVTVRDDDGVGVVINRLREHGVSRLPVMDGDGRLTGVVTTHDIADVVVRDMNKATVGERSGDIERVLDMPVYDVTSSPVATATVSESVELAVERMLENDYGGLIVVDPDDDSRVEGVLTKTDVLRALSYTEEEHLDVQVTNVSVLETLSRDAIRQSVEEVVDKYRKMRVGHAHVRFHEHKESMRGRPLIQCRIRLRTDKGQVAGSGEGYGAENAFHVALDKLERNVLELKDVTADEKYRGNLLRKLGGL